MEDQRRGRNSTFNFSGHQTLLVEFLKANSGTSAQQQYISNMPTDLQACRWVHKERKKCQCQARKQAPTEGRRWVFALGIKPKLLPLSYILSRPVEVLKQQASVLICTLPEETLFLNEWSRENLAKQKPKFLLEHRRAVSVCILIIVLWLFCVWCMHVYLYVHPSGSHRSMMDILL